jgi:hypothetical protein
MKKIVLSLILCSRNDDYMGNSRWRLKTTLNYIAQMVVELNRENEVEVLVTDWGSDIPLRDVLKLSSVATRIVSFIEIPPETARALQKDSPFAEVIALNVAARRSTGEFIGRIDQDTLVGKQFLEYFFDLYEGRQKLEVPLDEALFFSNQRMFPYRVVVRNPSLWIVDRYVHYFGKFMKTEISKYSKIFYRHGVGIWLIHRDLWNECGGYDERLIYMNSMEINMVDRLRSKYQVVNLGKLVNYAFYHLEHYHPLVPRKSSTHRPVNPDYLFENHDTMNPNGQNWGLVQYQYERLTIHSEKNQQQKATLVSTIIRWPSLMWLVIIAGAQMGWDQVRLKWKNITAKPVRIWRQRAQIIRDALLGQPLFRWPRLLVILWFQREQAHKQERQEHHP